jgi:hypothetical protein
MARSLRWKNNSVISAELRDGTFVLLQMLDTKGYLAALNHYREVDDWDGVVLAKSDVLFITLALRSFMARTKIRRVTNVDAIQGLKVPDGPTTKINTEPEWRHVTLWPGTEDEITVLVQGGKGLVGLHTSGRNSKGKIVDEYRPIKPSEYKKFKRMETAHLSDYPSLNERLLLCRGKGWNFDPMRNLEFDWPLDRECSVYAQIISGRVRLADLGYR